MDVEQRLRVYGAIYRYTGLMLGDKLLSRKMLTKDVKRQIKDLYTLNDDLSMEDCIGIARGTLEMQYGFYRPMVWCGFWWPRVFWSPVASVVASFVAIRRDIQALLRK
jgi:hypothetical protein